MKTTQLRFAALYIIILCAALFGFDAAAQRAHGEKSLGPRMGYVSRNSSVAGGIAFQYAFSKVVRLAPEVNIIFRHQDLEGLAMDVNVEFPISFGRDRWAFYPLLGAGFTSWSRHGIDINTNDDVTTHFNQMNINAGAGIELYCTSSLKLSLEGRYSLQRHFPTALAIFGIAYVF